MKWLPLLLVMMFPGSLAFADDTPNCKEPQNQSDMTLCAGLAYSKADKALNAMWPKIKADAENSDKDTGRHEYADALLASQKAWLAFRDAQCTWLGFSAHGGSLEPMLVNQCLADATNARIKELQDGGPQ